MIRDRSEPECGVVVVCALSGASGGSGSPLDGVAVFVLEIRNGKIVRDRAFMSKQAALKAVGQVK